MRKTDKKILVELLKEVINDTNEMFKLKSQPDAYIIGYLQGAVKEAIIELEK